MIQKIPEPVAEVIGEVVGDHYYNHRKIDSLFERAGAPGLPPEGSCVTKTTEWLRRCSNDPATDALSVLGKVLEPVMGYEPANESDGKQIESARERVVRVLERNGLSYVHGGAVRGTGSHPASLALEAMIRAHDLPNVEIEFRRAMESVEADPPTALCAACAILEALMRTYIEDNGLAMPTKVNLRELWKVMRKDLRQDPAQVEDDHVQKILSGQISIVDGIASLRTHASSAHGRGRKSYRVDAALAEHVVNAAHGFAVFQLRRWMARERIDAVRNKAAKRTASEREITRTDLLDPSNRTRPRGGRAHPASVSS